MAKQVKSVGELDRLSGLSDPVLCHILSFLGTKDAVRISILSPRWRHLSASLSVFDIDECIFSVRHENRNNFKNFVDRLLYFPNQSSLKCFKASHFAFDGDYSRLYGWICAALLGGVNEIDISSDESLMLPPFLCTCRSLVTLKLDIYGDINLPSHICLPNLKTLHLSRFDLSDGSDFRLVSSCLVLEDLVLELVELPRNINFNIHSLSLKKLVLDFEGLIQEFRRDFNYVVVINAPNLIYFKYADLLAKGYRLSTMDFLVHAEIGIFRFDKEAAYDGNRELCAIDLLQAVYNVKSLCLTIEQAETIIQMPCEPLLSFHNVVELRIYKKFVDRQGTWVIEFLHCVPNLKTLHLVQVLQGAAERGIKPLPEKVPSCLLFQLETIKCLHFEGDERSVEVIIYFLKHGSALEKLIIEMSSFLEESEQFSITKKLLGFPRNSNKCQVLAR
ncbi:hypothetical protein V6N13_069753 [Hibiscus sabdariffa]